MESSRVYLFSRQDIAPSKATCRSLFGEVDHEQTKKELQLQYEKLLEQKSEHWNFNFKEQKPGDNKDGLQWVPSDIDFSENTYTPGKSLIGALTQNTLSSASLESANSINVEPLAIEDCQIIKTVMGTQIRSCKYNDNTKLCGKKKKHQKTIDEFMKKKKFNSSLNLTLCKEPIASRLRSSEISV
ncbi:uncharacterized protein LOC100197618 [Hydra vulgaris]|uniref:uncharacterized protein LOC100197618 n=1 Tax=Hydra vulgaris TaxID=6087 RepID=UPI0001923AC9|nr:uncharacterized protein LOC100197618 [Hydra vulgaris]